MGATAEAGGRWGCQERGKRGLRPVPSLHCPFPPGLSACSESRQGSRAPTLMQAPLGARVAQ